MKQTIVMSMMVLFILGGSGVAGGTSDPWLPDEICKYVMSQDINTFGDDCSALTEQKTGSRYEDLNGDGTKELIFIYSGASCGAFYWVFELDRNMKWKNIGLWCGCDWAWDEKRPEPPPYKVKTTKHNGYRDIYTCGVSGFYNGKSYVGRRQ